jgi:prolyl-tRNA editing enzyme YbaK/EbsC (Cys-tRNA(Pro) deacylase)
VASDELLEELDRLGVPVEVVACDPALADTADFCAAYGYAPEDSANAIVVVGKSEPRSYAVCLLLAVHRLDVNGTVRRRLGSRKASFASAAETADLTGMTLGGVTPFGLPEDLPVWIDSKVLERPRVIVGGGSRDRKLLVTSEGLRRIPGSEVVEDLAR